MNKNVFSIQEAFAQRLFNIPDYQRGYSWETQQCQELIEDIELLPDGFKHYTGTLVLHLISNKSDQDESGTSYETFDVVDGQQRLTTLTILLKVIRQELSNFENLASLAQGLEKNYLFSKRLEDNEKLFKLTLNRDSREYFQANILGEKTDLEGATIFSHQRLRKAKSLFEEYCENKKLELKDGYKTWLQRLYNKITQSVHLSVYVVDSAADVGVIFEVMNNRGKPLTELEKVKNYLLYLTSKLSYAKKEELVVQINQTWTAIFEGFMAAHLGPENENQLLRAHWLMAYDYNKRNWEGSRSIKKRFNLKDFTERHVDLATSIRNYIKTLKSAATVYVDTEKPADPIAFNSITDEDEKKTVRLKSIKLKRLGTLASFRPLLIACRMRFPASGKEYASLVELLEKFAFRIYGIGDYRADTGQSSLFKFAFQFFHHQIDDIENLKRQVTGLLFYYQSHKSFMLAFDFNEADNNWYRWSPLKYLLYEYEEHLAAKNSVQYSWDYFHEKQLSDTIEHILPQNLEKKYWKDRFNKQEHGLFVHDLGNLCLTLNNSVYSDNPFPDKKGGADDNKPCYFQSSLAQERELVKFEHWTIESIQKRREKIAEWALKRWYIEPIADPEMEIEEEQFDDVIE